MTSTARRLSSLGSLLSGAGLVLLILACTAFLAVRYWFWPQADRYRDTIVAQLAQGIDRPVSIGAIETGWDGLNPTLRLVRVEIGNQDGTPALTLPALTAVLSWRSLLELEPRVASLRIIRPELGVVREADGRIVVAGFVFDPLDPAADPESSGDPAGRGLLGVLLAQERIEIVDGELRWLDLRSGAPELRLDRVQLALVNRGRAHRLSLLADAGELARRVDLRADFIRMPGGVPADWRRWRGDFYARTDALDLAAVRAQGLQAVLPGADDTLRPRLDAGRVDVQLWLSLFEGRLRELSGSLATEGLVLAQGDRSLELDELEAKARLVPAGDGYRVSIAEASLAEPGGLRLAIDGEALLELDPAGGPRAVRASFAPFDLGLLAQAVARAPGPIDGALRGELERLEPRGRIGRLSVRWQAEALAGAEPQLALAASFDRLRIAPASPARGQRLGRPGVEALAGRIELDNLGGRLTLADGTPRLSFPGLFEEPTIALESIGGELRWTRTPRADGPATIEVEIDTVRFESADAAGEASGRWSSAGGTGGAIDLTARLTRASAARVHRYLPVHIGPQTREWVRQAITEGEVRDARLVLRGALDEFPFRDPARGEFRVSAPLFDGRLQYAPGWPAIDAVRGLAVFERGGMQVRAETGMVFGVKLGETRAAIEDFRRPVLTVTGSGLGPAQDMVRFVNESPIAARIDQFTVDTRVSGSARLDLELALDLDQIERSRVQGTVALRDSEVLVDRTLPTFEGVTGILAFTGEGFELRSMSGTMLGGPISVSARTVAPGHIRIDARGEIDADGIRRAVDNPVTRQLSGRTAYRASIEARNRASRIRIESDLVGLASTLPEPFTKRAADAVRLVLENRPDAPVRADARPARDVIEARIGEAIQAVFERRRDPATESLRVHRGVFTVKVDPVLPESGFAVLMDIPMIDLDRWHRLLAGADADARAGGGGSAGQATAGSAGIPAGVPGAALPAAAQADFEEGFSLLPNWVSAWARVVRIGNRELHDVAFGATREGGRWRANVAAEELNGYFTWSEALPGEPIGTLTARFNRLAIPKSRVEDVETLLASSPEILPAIDVAAENLVLGEVELGALAVTAENRGEGESAAWVITRLSLDNPDAALRASGRWAIADDQADRATELDFDLELRDSGGLLSRFGLPGTVRGAPGRMSGKLRWNGVPFSINYPSLSGELALAIRQGQFLKVEPGIAKLIGVLSLQALPKRLSFDFRDVFAEGFLFDEIRGDARIAAGVARTSNLRMKGVQAQVDIDGSVDLARETQDLLVDVRPELNAGLASLAYAALANPALGLGSFVAQMVLRKPLGELFAYQVEVKGSWSDPDVIQKKKEPMIPQQESP